MAVLKFIKTVLVLIVLIPILVISGLLSLSIVFTIIGVPVFKWAAGKVINLLEEDEDK